MRDRPAPRTTGWLIVVSLLVILGTLGAAAIPLPAQIREQAWRANVRADQRKLVDAIELYRAAHRRLPERLADLTIASADRDGRTVGPWIAELPSCCYVASAPYEYRRWADGRYAIVWRPGADVTPVWTPGR